MAELAPEKDLSMVVNAVQPHENDKENVDENVDNFDEVEEINEEEFKALNDKLDQLNVVLDTLETKNDSIHAGLMELLKSNREARKQFQESQKDEKNKEEAKSQLL